MLDNHVESERRPPTLSGGRYVIVGVLGRGGNAGVYQGWDNHLRRWRAIKVLSNDFIRDDHVRARFAQEAATMARLDHPNLVKVYDISDDINTPHIVMELCAGGAIIDWMKVHGAVPPRAACEVIRSTALAVSVAHAEDIIHRDIKPQNILIDHHGIVKLTDFGIARDENNSLTMAGQTMGTYAFMAPEQRHDSTTVDPRTDVYSLGATLFTLIAVKTTTELFVAEREDEILAGIPGPVVDFILRACQYKPSKRYQDIDEVVAALDAVLDALPPDPQHPSLQILSKPLPAKPPITLSEFGPLEDLLKSLALNSNSPTYKDISDGTELEATTLNSSATAEQKMFPYYMPTTGGTPAPAGLAASILNPSLDERPSYIDPEVFQTVTEGGSPVAARPKTKTKTKAAPQARESAVPEVPVDDATTEDAPLSPAFRLSPWVVVAGVGVFFALLFSAAIGLGANDVSTAAVKALRAEKALMEAAERSSPVIQEVQQEGGDAEALRKAYFDMKDAPPEHQGTAGLIYAEQLVSASNAAHVGGTAAALVAGVQKEKSTLENARRELDAAAGSPLGALALGLGVASTRP